MKKVKDLCEGKEICKFTPAPSFFGPRRCTGIKKTWVNWQCINHIDEITRHVDGGNSRPVDGGNSCDGKITKEGAVHGRDFHSPNTEKNRFDLTCKNGCIKIKKVG